MARCACSAQSTRHPGGRSHGGAIRDLLLLVRRSRMVSPRLSGRGSASEMTGGSRN